MIEDILKIINNNHKRIDDIESKINESGSILREMQIDELRSLRAANQQINLIAQTAITEYFKKKLIEKTND